MNNTIVTAHKFEVLEKIDSFLELEKGWHYGEGIAFSKETVSMAKKFAEQAIWSVFDTDAFPGIDGEIMVTVYFEDHYLEFTIESSGEIEYVYEFKDEEIDESENLNFREAEEKLDKFCENIWHTSGLSTESILITKESDSIGWPLKIQRAVESLSSFCRASMNQGTVFVST